MGISIIISLVVFILGVRYFADLPVFGGTYQLNTSFTDAEGLIAGANVRVRGVDVGKVESVVLDPKSRVVHVNFHVDGTLKVPSGSQTAIRGFETFGSVHMELMLGPNNNPAIPEGGFVPGSEEQSALGSVMNRAPQMAGRIDTMMIEAQLALREATIVLRQANASLMDPNSNLQQSFAELRRATASMNRIVSAEEARFGRVMAGLEQSSGNFQRFSANLSTFSDENMDTLATAVRQLSQATVRVNNNLSSLDTLSVMISRVNRGEGSLGLLLNDASLYNNLDSTAAGFNTLVEDFQRNPGRYLRQLKLFSLF